MQRISILVVLMMLVAFRAEAKPINEPASGTGGRTEVPFEELRGDQCFMFSSLVPTKVEGNHYATLPLQLVIDNDEDYQKLFRPDLMRQSCAGSALSKVRANVVFSQKTVLGFWGDGSCASTGFTKNVWRDDRQKRIIYSIAVIERPMACSGPGFASLNLIAIPKVPAGYKVVFQDNSERGTGGVTVTSFSQTPTYHAPDLTVTAINGVPINQALPASPTQPTQAQEIVNDPADDEGLMFIARYSASTAEAVEAELKKGADVNKQDKGGNTALMFSVMYGFHRPDTVKALLLHGARVNMQSNNGTTALMLAVRNGAGIDIVNMLLEHGADPNIQNGAGVGWTALMNALGAKDEENVVKTLLQHGANPNIKTGDGYTALMMASSPSYVREPNPKVIQLLSDAMSSAKPVTAPPASSLIAPSAASRLPEEQGHAYDINMRSALKMLPEWFGCKTSGDCALVPVSCNPSLAAAKAFKDRVAALLPPSECTKVVPDTSIAVCSDGQCSTVIQAYSAQPRPQ
jgi:hypothetical protein